MSKWSLNEIEILKYSYPNKPLDYVLTKINRTKNSVYIKAKRLGLKNFSLWTDKEVELLVKLYSSNNSLRDIAIIMNRSKSSITSKVSKIGLSREHYTKRVGFSDKHKKHLKEARVELMKNNPILLENMIAGGKEYHRNKTDYPSSWNKGMKPWEWMNISREEFHRIATSKRGTKPTSIERRVIQICKDRNLPYKYVGNFKVWIDGKNPDFINNNGENKLIELFGNYWHSEDDEVSIPDHYGKYGFKTLVIWESELHKLTDNELENRIREF